jgi:pimeloyl-ACP methyl ester carboxylesterase
VTVVLLHALPLDERMWEPTRKALRSVGAESVAPRLYGRGRTMEDWAASILGEVDGGGLVLVGASMGGYCAQRLLAYADARALVLVGARAGADTPERRQARDETIRLIREEGLEALWEKQRPALLAADADPAVVERARQLVLSQDPEELTTAVAAMRDRPDSTDLLRETAAPVLVARGEHDGFLTAEEAEAMAAAARNGTTHTFAGSGHLPSLERPEDFNRVVEDFLVA